MSIGLHILAQNWNSVSCFHRQESLLQYLCRFTVSVSYRALVWFFSGVPSHVDYQHILSFEWLLFPCTLLPATDKLLLLPMNVIIIDVLKNGKEEAR